MLLTLIWLACIAHASRVSRDLLEDSSQPPGKMLASVGAGVARHAMKGRPRHPWRIGNRIVRAWAPAMQSRQLFATTPLWTSSHNEPHFEPAEQGEKKNSQNDPKRNAGKAFESLSRDMPLILKFEDDAAREAPTDWSIYTDAFETDATNVVNPMALRLFFLQGSPMIKGLKGNQQALQDLRVFCSKYVKEDVVRAKTGMGLDKETGNQVITSQWRMELTMQRFKLRLLQPFTRDDIERVFTVSAVSKFHFDDEGKIYRHSLDHLDIRPLRQESSEGGGSPNMPIGLA